MQKEWKTIGPVAKKYSDAIWKRFISACDYFFEQKNKATSSQLLDDFLLLIQVVYLNGTLGGSSPQSLYREREKLVRAADAMKNELQTYENNLGFLTASSKKGNSLLTELNRKVEKLKADIELVKQKIKVIDDSIRSAE